MSLRDGIAQRAIGLTCVLVTLSVTRKAAAERLVLSIHQAVTIHFSAKGVYAGFPGGFRAVYPKFDRA